MDYYEILGIPRDAPVAEIKKAFRKKASECHPDKNPGDASKEAEFKELNEAFQTLGDKDKRSLYDTYGKAADQTRNGWNGSPGFVDFEKDFQEFWQRAATQAARRREGAPVQPPDIRGPGDDVNIELIISLVEAAYGVKKKIQINSQRPIAPCLVCVGTGAEPGTRRVTCNLCAGSGKTISFGMGGTRASICRACNGRGATALNPCKSCMGHGKIAHNADIIITIPAGIENGQQLRLAGQGTPGMPPGDLYVTIKVAPHDVFIRSGRDLTMQLKVPLVKALSGGKVEYAALNGDVHTIDVPPCTQSGSTIMVRGAGIRTPVSSTSGHLYACIQIMIPTSMTPRAKKLTEELAEELAQSR